MYKNLLAKYYQGNKERLREKLVKDIKIFLKKKKKKGTNMVVKVTKISQKMKNNSLLSKEKNIQWERNVLLCVILKNNDLESSFHEEYKDVLNLQI